MGRPPLCSWLLSTHSLPLLSDQLVQSPWVRSCGSWLSEPGLFHRRMPSSLHAAPSLVKTKQYSRVCYVGHSLFTPSSAERHSCWAYSSKGSPQYCDFNSLDSEPSNGTALPYGSWILIVSATSMLCTILVYQIHSTKQRKNLSFLHLLISVLFRSVSDSISPNWAVTVCIPCDTTWLNIWVAFFFKTWLFVMECSTLHGASVSITPPWGSGKESQM